MLPIHSVGAGSAAPMQPQSISAPQSNPVQPPTTDDANFFEEILVSANQDQQLSNEAVRDLVTGNNGDVQQVVMQVVKAEMSFQLFMEVRNKVIDSYNELMRMQF